MSQSQPNGNIRTIIFMACLSFICALILSIVANILAKPQENARDLDRSKQMLIAAKVLDYHGYFLIKDDKGEYIPAKYTDGGKLVPGTKEDIASSSQILDLYKKRFIPLLVDHEGNIKTFKEAGIDANEYIEEFRKVGYYKLPEMLIYEVLPNGETDTEKAEPIGYVIPVNGFGLWDAIYGYLAIKPDGDTVIGITWYQQKETPGLGANIAEPEWQSHFPGKLIFQESAGGTTDFKTAPLGITVVKGKVSEVLGDVPKARSAVDGMSGATLTGNGVTDAYKATLAPYRPFLIKIHDKWAATEEKKQ